MNNLVERSSRFPTLSDNSREDNARSFLKIVYPQDPSVFALTQQETQYAAERSIERGMAERGAKIHRKIDRKKFWDIGEYANTFISGARFDEIAVAAKEDVTPDVVRGMIVGFASRMHYDRSGTLPETARELLTYMPSYAFSPGKLEINTQDTYLRNIQSQNLVREEKATPIFTLSSLKRHLPSKEDRDFTADEEIELVKWVRAGIFVEAVRANNAETVLDFNEEEADSVMYLGKVAQEYLIEEHKNKVIEVASTFKGRGVSFEDLVAIGNIGMLKAFIQWNEGRGARLYTYIKEKATGEIRNALRDNYSRVKVPHKLRENLLLFWKTRKKLISTLNHIPTTNELAAELGIDEKEINEMSHVTRSLSQSLSLDAFEEDEVSESFLIRLLNSQVGPGAADLSRKQKMSGGEDEDTLERKKLKRKAVVHLLQSAGLTSNERKVICLRFGLALPGEKLAYGPLSQPDAADELGMTYKSLWSIEKSALDKIKNTVDMHIGDENYEQVLFELKGLG